MYTHVHIWQTEVVHASSHMEHALPMDTHGCLGTFAKTHLVKRFGNRESDTEKHTRRMSSQQDQLDLRWKLQKQNLLGFTHAAHIYSTRGVTGTFKAGGLTEQKKQKRNKIKWNKTSISPNPGQSRCQDLMAESGWIRMCPRRLCTWEG